MMATQIIRLIISTTLVLWMCSFANGQETEWYSVSKNHGVVIQNSFPKGGPYNGPTEKHFNYSSLVFFTRVINQTDEAIEIDINFSADSIPIPKSPGTFMKLFLPQDTMSFEKEKLYNYGVSYLKSFNHSTNFCKKIQANEECLFYVITIFYQTKKEYRNQTRGGNRAAFIFDGQELYFNMLPQIKSRPCGTIKFIK